MAIVINIDKKIIVKIAYIIESTSKSGGSFYQTLNLYDDLIKNFNKNHKIIIYTNKQENLKNFKNNKIFYTLNLIDKIIIKLSIINFFRFFLNFFSFKTSFERLLLKDNIDLIIFPNPTITHYTIRKIKFVSTIFDLCHLDHKQFPEVDTKEFDNREKLYNHLSNNGCGIITNSLILKKQISKRYFFPNKKIFSIPFNPVKKKFKVRKNKEFFFLYPANYWMHKNHEIIIKAVKILSKNKKINFKCIFTGSDKGYLSQINRLISFYNLEEFFELKGFVNENELLNLYNDCLGVVMTSYFGPTNLPPLESFIYKKPLIYNEKFSKEIPEKNCLMININNENELSKAMLKVLNNKYPKNKISNASKYIISKKKETKKEILNFQRFLDQLKN